MCIDFLGLEALHSIAERGSFQRAAAYLNLLQTAISHRIRKLEEELGLKLFARTTREVTLTRAGIDYLPKAQNALAELEQSFDAQAAGRKKTGTRRLVCLPAFAVNYRRLFSANFTSHSPACRFGSLRRPLQPLPNRCNRGKSSSV